MITDTSKYDRLNQQLKQHIYIYSIYIYTCNMIYIYINISPHSGMLGSFCFSLMIFKIESSVYFSGYKNRP